MRQARAQRGQILPIVALALVCILGTAAFSIDVGYAYYAKRQLQAAVDAAALAGAQDLPSSTLAPATALTYFKDNTPANLPAFGFSYQLKCTATAIIATGCNASVNPNELYVNGTSSTNTWFAGLFGFNHFDVSAHASACSPCSSTPVDVVIVIDRTGSMCLNASGGTDCTDMNGAKAGVQTMLGILNPPYAQIGMVAFPPVQTTTTGVCASPYNSESPTTGFPADLPTFHNGGYNGYYAFDGYDKAGRGYVTDALNGNYKDSAGKAVPTSGLYIHTLSGNSSACIPSDGLTSYSEALRQAQAELLLHGRLNVPNFIVFLTDGEANIGSVYSKSDAKFPQGGSDDQKPCQAGVDAATAIKATGTTIYSIGYSLGSKNCTHGVFLKKATTGTNPKYDVACTTGTALCFHFGSTGGGDLETPNITSHDAVEDIASPGHFKSTATAAELTTIFASIASDIASGSSRLVDDSF
jgi:Flp pilus assembly protein TadG